MRPDSVSIAVPYCGLPPSPGELWSRWNLDPVLIAALLVCLIIYLAAVPAAARRGWVDRGNIASFLAGWFVLTAALISPLCPLSVSLFAARVGQHMIIVLIAVPLIAAGRPIAAARAAIGARSPTGPETRSVASAIGATAAFAVTLWFWHMPFPYDATFASDIVYWAMHITMILSALWLWGVLLDRRRAQAAMVIGVGLATSTQMSLLGAAITFASHALYAPHAATTAAWGVSQLLDQQLGGAIMWVPGGVIFLAAAMIALWSIVGAPRPALDMKPR